MKATIRILNEVTANVVGLTGSHLKFLHDKYALFATGYIFHPSYVLGRWDGRIKHFSMSGSTFVFLLEEILPILIKWKYSIDIDDQRTAVFITPDKITDQIFADRLHPASGKPIIMRPYQVDAVNSMIEHGCGMCIAATGAGKTLICAAIVHSYANVSNIQTITIVPDRTLIMQTKETYVACGLDVGEYSGSIKDLSHTHIVSTWQALQHNAGLVSSFGLVLVDECHKTKGAILTDIVRNRASQIPHRFGVTGTLPKEEIDLLGVRISLGKTRYIIPAHKLIDIGVLSSIDIACIQLEENLMGPYNEYCENTRFPKSYSVFKKEYFPDYSSEKSHLLHNATRIKWIADKIQQELDQYGNVLCLVGSIPLARKLSSMLPGSICVNGADVKKPEDRQKIYDLYGTRNDLIVIATSHIAGTGLSIDRIFSLVTVDLGKSFTKVIQALGRGLRTSEDKTSVHVVDIGSDLFHSNRHLKDRIAYYKEARYPYKIVKTPY